MTQPMNISAFVAHVRSHPSGLNLGALGWTNGRMLVQGEGSIVNIDNNPTVVRSVGLITCASVIFASTDSNMPNLAYVYHAPSGVLTVDKIQEIENALGNPPAQSILVVFAHPKAHDDGYQGSINLLLARGYSRQNVVEIENLTTSTFGIDNRGMIGY